MERACVIVAFGDVIGFGAWIRRASNTVEARSRFVEKFYREMESFVRSHKCIQIKYMGDGLMILKELPEGKTMGLEARRFVADTAALNRRLSRIVAECDFPRPDGFRTRMATSIVDKIQVLDPVDPERKRKIWEFVGYAVNLSERLLHVSPGHPFVCHESVVEMVGRRAPGIRFKHLAAPQGHPKSVDSEDLKELWSVELTGRKR